MKNFKRKLSGLLVPIMFILLSAIAIPLSKYTGHYLTEQMVTRMARNLFLVLSLIIPITAGMGINFGMALGAMAAQIALILVTDWGIAGAGGLVVAMIVSTPIAIGLGYFAGSVLNRAKGREMITSMILSLFMIGIYQFVLLYIFGGVIPMRNHQLLLSKGYGVRNTFTLANAHAFDRFIDRLFGINFGFDGISVPLFTFILIGAACLFTVWFQRTKLGHDMRAVGQDMKVAANSGINVDKVRIQATIISTVMAAYGQIIYLQNIGTMNTYAGLDQAALFAAASLLVGGATVAKAGIPQAILGTLLFHLMFIVMPEAGKTVTGNAMIGEYFRTFISYAIVTIALILHAWNRLKEREYERQEMREIRKNKRNACIKSA